MLLETLYVRGERMGKSFIVGVRKYIIPPSSAQQIPVFQLWTSSGIKKAFLENAVLCVHVSPFFFGASKKRWKGWNQHLSERPQTYLLKHQTIASCPHLLRTGCRVSTKSFFSKKNLSQLSVNIYLFRAQHQNLYSTSYTEQCSLFTFQVLLIL